MRALIRKWRIGAKIQRLRRAINYGPKVEIGTALAKRRYLKAVRAYPTMSAGSGKIDCFMLLNEPRLWEGLWSLYSFRLHFGPCRLIVLNDGTLKSESIEILSSLFPGISIPEVKNNDREIDAYLAELGLGRCREWRSRFVFFRKLIDPLRLSQSDRIVLLDSDCLHFRPPTEVQAWAESGNEVRYIADINRHSSCASPEVLENICGAILPEFFCAGYLCVPKASVDLRRIERYLSEDCFESQLAAKRFSHVAEQTLYAMEAGVVGAKILPARYATCPDPDDQVATMGHFCGGSFERTWFYTRGLPLVSRQVLNDAS